MAARFAHAACTVSGAVAFAGPPMEAGTFFGFIVDRRYRRYFHKNERRLFTFREQTDHDRDRGFCYLERRVDLLGRIPEFGFTSHVCLVRLSRIFCTLVELNFGSTLFRKQRVCSRRHCSDSLDQLCDRVCVA